MDSITLKAYAKINLALDVLGKRPDGYHEVKMIMQTINLFDRVTIKPTVNPDILITTNLPYLPTNENNIVYGAVKQFCEATGVNSGVFINLEKKIPVAAGLAGGSADAAAALTGLNSLFHTGLSLEDLMKIGVKLGADVPYCLLKGTALSEGIGEILTPLNPVHNFHCLIVKPPVSVSTKYVYEHLDLSSENKHPDINGMVSAIKENDVAGITSRLGNILESVTIDVHPEILKIKEQMISYGAINALMSGSGPTVFGLFDSLPAAKKAFYSFKIGAYGKQTFLTEFYQP